MIALLCLFFGICPSPEPSSLGDYGDAPDGTPTGYDQTPNYNPITSGYALTGSFPTLTANDGAWVSNTNTVTLGPSVSNEVSATDPNDPDGEPNILVPQHSNRDSDDGLELDICPFTPPLGPVTTPPFGTSKCSRNITVYSNVGGTFYLNLLADFNRNGMWGGESFGHPEWVIENQQVIIDPVVDNIAKIALPDDANNEWIWMRIAITTQPIQVSDWDGTGEFNSGEIEDHILLPIDGVLSYNATTLSAPTGQVLVPPYVVDPTDDVDIAGVDGVPGSFDVTGNLSGPQGTFVATCPTVSSSGPSHMYPVSTTCSVTATIVEPGQYCWDITLTETTGNYDPSMVALLDDIPDECFTVVEITIIPCTFHDCGNGVLRP